MTGYFIVEAAILAPAVSMLITVAIRNANTRRLARKALRLADRRIAILAARKARAMEAALVAFLGTAEGASLASDPRVADRLNFFLALRGERPARSAGPRHRKFTADHAPAQPKASLAHLTRPLETA